MTAMTADDKVKEAVREAYGNVARRYVGESAQASCCGPAATDAGAASAASQTSCCGSAQQTIQVQDVAVQASSSCCGPSDDNARGSDKTSRLYSIDEVAELPDTVTEASLGCGNPTAIAELESGEVVLDLGSGGGIDCFLAAKKVGPQGHVIGLDMTPDMIRLARRNAKTLGVTNVDFRFGEMEEIPLPDDSVDVIISNCVINLSPDKAAVFGEAHRVLRPGGRMTVSDIVIDGQLPASIRNRLDAWAGCIAGALDEQDYLAKMSSAGFKQIDVLSRTFVKISESAESHELATLLREDGLEAHEIDHKVASITVKALKPQ